MCCIVYRPKTAVLSYPQAKAIFDDNPHGWGIMWVQDGVLRTAKGLRFQEYIETLDKVDEYDYVVHTRWKTHGRVNIENCHPFRVNAHVALMHNGIFSNYVVTDKSMSDTWHFAQKMTKIMQDSADVLADKAFIGFLESQAGDYNKLVFMTSSNTVHIVNEKAGQWYDGMWFSNGSSLLYSRRSLTTAKSTEPEPSTSNDNLVKYVTYLANHPRYYGLPQQQALRLATFDNTPPGNMSKRDRKERDALLQVAVENVEKLGISPRGIAAWAYFMNYEVDWAVDEIDYAETIRQAKEWPEDASPVRMLEAMTQPDGDGRPLDAPAADDTPTTTETPETPETPETEATKESPHEKLQLPAVAKDTEPYKRKACDHCNVVYMPGTYHDRIRSCTIGHHSFCYPCANLYFDNKCGGCDKEWKDEFGSMRYVENGKLICTRCKYPQTNTTPTTTTTQYTPYAYTVKGKLEAKAQALKYLALVKECVGAENLFPFEQEYWKKVTEPWEKDSIYEEPNASK